MNRRYIEDGKITLIGKETKNIETQILERSPTEVCFNKDELKKKILAMTPEGVKGKGFASEHIKDTKRQAKRK